MLSFLFFQKTHKSAQEVCKKVSHRLAYIDTPDTWDALLDALGKFQKSIDIKNQSVSFRFHLGPIYKTNGYFWNTSNTEIQNEIFAKNLRN